MIARSPLSKGWCPGALRPMESGDGLLLRIRPRVGTLSIANLSTIAKTAATFGSGQVDLTNRGNLQLRGLTAASHTRALAVLSDAGLLDADASAEAVRNILLDPLSGIDPSRADGRLLARQLEDALRDDRTFWQLPGKFGFSFSGSAAPHIGGRSTDIMVFAPEPGTFAVSLDGNADVAALLPSNRVFEAMTGLAAVFLELRVSDPSLRRMRDAVERSGSAMIYAAAGLKSSALRAAGASVRVETAPVGPLRYGGRIFAAGVGLPFGRIDAQQLEAMVECASSAGLESVRVGPERVFVFPLDRESSANDVLAEAARQGLITAPDDPRLYFDVCPGSPACANATTDTRRDARRIADAIHGQAVVVPSIHLSGCEKGCAHRGAAALTLVARDGRYDVICNDGPLGPVALQGVNAGEIDSAIARFIVGLS